MAGFVAALGLCLLACERSKATKGPLLDSSSQAAGSRACVVQLAGNWLNTCALLGSGEARCWGGGGSRPYEAEPVALRGYPGPVSRLFVDRFALCASPADGSLWCDEYRSPYDPPHLPQLRREKSEKWPQQQPFRAVQHLTAAGRCVLTKDELRCWEERGEPVLITGLPSKPTQLVGGINYACVLLENGQVFCRGYNVRGQLGILEGATEEERNSSRLQKYAGFTRVKALGDDTRLIAAGLDHSCALKRDGSVRCWGQNDKGQIGKGDISICERTGGLLLSCTPEEGLEPSRVEGLPADIRDLALALGVGCAIDGQGSAWCWGELYEPTPRPVRLNVGAPVTALAIGEHWCALLRDGRVLCQKDRQPLAWNDARTMSLGCP